MTWKGFMMDLTKQQWVCSMPLSVRGFVQHATVCEGLCAACHCLWGALSDRLRQSNRFVWGYHWWRELALRSWPRDKLTRNRSNSPRQVKGKGRRMLIICFDVQRIVPGRPNTQSHNTVTFYGDCENLLQFHPKLWWQETGCCIMTVRHLTLPLSPRNFLPKTWLVISYPPYSADLAPLKLFCGSAIEDTIILIQLKSSRQNCRTHLPGRKKRQKLWEWCIHMEGDFLMGDGGQ
jgi:hypothetical protein